MILRPLPRAEDIKGSEDIPHFTDHCLYVQKFNIDFNYPTHITGLGLLSVLDGKAQFSINEEHLHLDNNAFVFLNRGSQLAIKGEQEGTFVILYFNNVLSEIIAESLFQANPKFGESINDYQDYALVEHVHYTNASLKNFLPLLIDLGSSCASFHALKADMVIRTILDHVIYENFVAIQTSSKLEVTKKTTRVALYKRMSMVREWVRRNYASSVTLQQMADIALLNPYHFLRIFKRTFGITPHQYLTDVRIAEAQTLLLETHESISSVCNAVGFDSISSFSRLFKGKVGVAPSLFRQERMDIR